MSRLPALELRSVFYPMGFPVEIETNSPNILAAAIRAWVRYPALARGAPVHLRVIVTEQSPDGGADELSASDPRVGFDGQWMTIGHGSGNHARADLSAGRGEIHLTKDTAVDLDYINYHFVKPLVYLLLAPRHYAFVHASSVALNGRAIMLCGDASAGKTCLAFACARHGWTFLSGDATHLLHRSPDFCVAGRPFTVRFRESARDLFPELIAWPAKIRPNGKSSIEADTDKLNLLTAFRAPASHIVFLERNARGPARIEEISADETARRLDEAVFFGDENTRHAQQATLRRFASLPVVRLRYSNVDDAEAVLRGLSLGAILGAKRTTGWSAE